MTVSRSTVHIVRSPAVMSLIAAILRLRDRLAERESKQMKLPGMKSREQ